MTTLSIGKTFVPAIVIGAASVAAIVYAVVHIPHRPQVESGAAGVMSQAAPPPQTAAKSVPAPPVTRDATAAPASTAAPALASAQNKLADLSAGLGTSPPPAAADPSLPAFDVARVEAGGDAVIAGRAAPGATVDLMRNGERLDRAVADSSGQFVMVPSHLPAGTYEVTLSTKLADGTVAQSRQGVTVSVKEADASTGSIAASAAQAATPAAKPQDTTAPPQQAMASVSDEPASAPKSGSAANSTRTVVRGDSLWRISRVTYGAGEQYAILYRANRDRIRNPNLIRPGQVLVLPVKHH